MKKCYQLENLSKNFLIRFLSARTIRREWKCCSSRCIRDQKDYNQAFKKMAVGKNKKYKPGGKKGDKKRPVDPFTRKDWYDVRVPSLFNKRCIGKTLVNRTVGQVIASDNLKGRVFEATLAELQNDEGPERNFRKIRFIAEAVDGKHILTNFHGMDLTTDKYRSMVMKWQDLIEATVDAKTLDGYVLRSFCMGFTRKSKDSQRKTSYAYNSQKKAIRARMVETTKREVSNCNLKEAINKLALDMISKDIERSCELIYPLHNVYIRKVKVMKKPRFDLHKLLEMHSSESAATLAQPVGIDSGGDPIPFEGVVLERPATYEPPIQPSV